jgi:hypothetical protein
MLNSGDHNPKMRLRSDPRIVAKSGMVLGASLLALVVGGGPALADCDPGPNSGNSSPNLSANRWAYGIWSGGTNTFDLTVNVSNNMGDPTCVVAFFDWNTGGTGHFDARAARTCKGNSDRSVEGSGDWTEASYPNRDHVAVQKLGVCQGDKDAPIGQQSCVDSAATECSVSGANPVDPDFPNVITSAWVRKNDGTVAFLEAPNANYLSNTQ